MASSHDKDRWTSSQASNIALLPMTDLSVKASAKRSVASTTGGPEFVRQSLWTRMRNQLQPYISRVQDFFDRTKELEVPSEELYNCLFQRVIDTLIEHYMEVNNLEGSSEDVDKFCRNIPLSTYDEIRFLLTEMSIIQNTENACAKFNDKAVESTLDIEAAFELMYEILNSFSLDP